MRAPLQNTRDKKRGTEERVTRFGGQQTTLSKSLWTTVHWGAASERKNAGLGSVRLRLRRRAR